MVTRETNAQEDHAAAHRPAISGVYIRRARPGDLDACARIEDVCYHGHGASRERIELRIRKYPQGFRVAVLDRQVVGFINSGCIVEDDITNENLKELEGHDLAGKTRVVFSLAVDPQFQGRGIGQFLLGRFISDSKKSGAHSVLLICRRSLIPFYQRFGFVYRQPSNATYGGHQWHEMGLVLP